MRDTLQTANTLGYNPLTHGPSVSLMRGCDSSLKPPGTAAFTSALTHATPGASGSTWGYVLEITVWPFLWGKWCTAPRWSLLGLLWIGGEEIRGKGPAGMRGEGGQGAGHLPASLAAVQSGCPSECTRSHRRISPSRHPGLSPPRSRLLGASPGPHWWLSRPSGRRESATWPPAPETTPGIRSYFRVPPPSQL